MKRVITLIIALVMVMSVFAFKDVGLDHWAYDYVTNLTDKGIIPVDSDTFDGSIPLYRAEASLWLTRLLTYVENSPMIAKAEDIERFENVVKSVTKELDAMKKDVSDLNEFKATTSKNMLNLKFDTYEKLDEVNARIDDTNAKLDALSAEWKSYTKLFETLTNSYSDVKSAAYRAKNASDANSEDILMLFDEIDKVSGQSENIKALESRVAMNEMFVKALPSLSRKVASIEKEAAENTAKSTANEAKLADLENTVSMFKVKLDDSASTANRAKNIADANTSDLLSLYDNVDVLSSQLTDVTTRVTTLEAAPKSSTSPLLWVLALAGVGLGAAAMILK